MSSPWLLQVLQPAAGLSLYLLFRHLWNRQATACTAIGPCLQLWGSPAPNSQFQKAQHPTWSEEGCLHKLYISVFLKQCCSCVPAASCVSQASFCLVGCASQGKGEDQSEKLKSGAFQIWISRLLWYRLDFLLANSIKLALAPSLILAGEKE